MDVAASEFYKDDGKYDLDFKNKNNDGSFKKTSDQVKKKKKKNSLKTKSQKICFSPPHS